MSKFQDKVAIVTGGASGIGKALCEELAQRGAVVMVADLNASGAEKVASALAASGGRARAVSVDVSDEAAVRKLVEETASQHGRLDYMFNNAGIAVVGEVRDVDMDHWRRLVDVNLWGVIYGSTNAYRVMLEQGFGHIVNTSSMAGLLPLPSLTAYVATKHAVVGLSLALRTEGRAFGVKVSVVCPGFVQTGIYEASTILQVDRTRLLAKLPVKPMEAAKAARGILRGVVRNKGIILVPRHVRLFWWLHRLHPALLNPLYRKMVRELRSLREPPG